MKKYILGNWLRGYVEGEFTTLDEAWSFLSTRFLLSWPSEGGRHVCMWVNEPNEYGFTQSTLCKQDFTELNDLNKTLVLHKCKDSPYILKISK